MIELINTGELVRIPRKLKKRLLKDGRTVTAASKFKYGPWELFVVPENGWVTIIKYGPNYRGW